ncbi:MAG: carboxypeptidase-like regulatory domain-containing protein [Bacteroidota bacterium]
MKTTKRISLAIIMLFSMLSFGQEITITGIVLDEKGEPLPGVNIVPKGTKNSVSTDFDGKYSIRVERRNKPVLVYSYIEYKTVSIIVGKKNAINVSMRPSSVKFNEVISEKYYPFQKKTDLTGPVATVCPEDLIKIAIESGKEITIRGTVIDEIGMPIPEVNVVIKETKSTVSTDFEGKYSIRAKKGDQIVFSYVGYETGYAIVENSDKINITMKTSKLDEVKITQGHTPKKADLTGAVISISADDLRKTDAKGKTIRTISGTVIDNTGFPIPGVNVVIKGTKNSASTDFDGKYRIKLKKGKKIVFSYIGYETAQVTIGKINTINFQMKVSTKIEGEVRVPGFPNYNREKSE